MSCRIPSSQSGFGPILSILVRAIPEEQGATKSEKQAVASLTAGVRMTSNQSTDGHPPSITDELLQRHPVGDPSYPELQNINATGKKKRQLCPKNCSPFSRQQTRPGERIMFSEALSDMYLDVETEPWRTGFSWKSNTASRSSAGDGGSVAIRQWIMNLCVNAAAMRWKAQGAAASLLRRNVSAARIRVPDTGLTVPR